MTSNGGVTCKTGTVTSVASGNGLTGGPITTTGTLSINSAGLITNALTTWNGTNFVATGTPSLTAGYFIATSTTASTFKYASTTGLTVTGGAFSSGVPGVKGYVLHDYTNSNPFLGIFDTGNNAYYGIATTLPAPTASDGHTVVALGGYYNGLGVGGSTNTGDNPIFGVLNSSQSGNGIGSTALTVYANNKIKDFYNVLDNGAGFMGLGTTTPYRQLSVGNSGVFGGNVTAESFTATSTTATSTFAGDVTIGSGATSFSVNQQGHMYASSTAPTLSSGVIDGTDQGGRVTGCSSACTVTFANAYTRTPSCLVQEETGSITNTLSYTPSATTLVVTQTSLGTFDFTCRGR